MQSKKSGKDIPVNSAPSKSGKRTYYPLFLDITDKQCLVIGGGKVAERKVAMLLESGANVTVISPRATKSLQELARLKKVTFIKRTCTQKDVTDAALVFTCTNNTRVNKEVKRSAALRKIPVNVADDPRLCDFIVPSIVRKDDIIIAISTSARLPFASKQLREKLETLLTDDYLDYVRILSQVRGHVLKATQNKSERERIMKKIARMTAQEIVAKGVGPLLKMVKQNRKAVSTRT